MPYLTKESADALCTVITFGFFSLEGYKVILQSEPPKEVDASVVDEVAKKQAAEREALDEAATYQKVVDAYFKVSGKRILCDQSFKQRHMPYVLAKAPGDNDGLEAERALIKVIPVINELFLGADIPDPPYGAYIGGVLQEDKFTIIGPSALRQYKPEYRKIEDIATIESSYNSAKKATNCSCCIIDRLPLTVANEEDSSKQIQIIKLSKSISENYRKDLGLFASYHGMIQVMSQLWLNKEGKELKSDAMFEVALGKRTTKVSSCLPCSLFMMANGRPASSTHLGRGDNWGIPEGCPQPLIDAWKKHVIAYYTEGLRLFESSGNKYSGIEALMFDYQKKEQIIPEIFLEALTFESKFTDRILNTLKTLVKSSI